MRSPSLFLGTALVGLFLALVSFLYPVDPNAPDFLRRLSPPPPATPWAPTPSAATSSPASFTGPKTPSWWAGSR